VDHFYSEKLLRLPHSYICFEPPGSVPEPGPLPALKNGFITFASFNALKKVNVAVIDLWARVLAAVPDAQLLLKSPALGCAATRGRTIARFADAGVPVARLKLLGGSSFQDHLAAMRCADIALDTFPYSGGITTLESLWMGLPVITWPGETFASRHSFGYLNTIGMTDLIAASGDEYIDHAVRLARDIERLTESRAGMRTIMLSSPLADRDGFATSLAAILNSIYQSVGQRQ
jgi:predicted O-linked N-acetylglucosamine transferase (SPINDLY family)